ncbi:MAG: glycosyltransferase family 1 protein [Anaerolineaceae bacterium]|nr:glycosyltransferase family 1 protein [Anaerolineaceae bacterium]
MNIVSYLKPRIEYRIARLIELPLKAAYNQQHNSSIPEDFDKEIIQLGLTLRDDTLNQYQDKFKKSNYRFLFQMPQSGVGLFWFQDLAQCLTHCGIPTQTISITDPDFYQIWESFKPNIFISMDSSSVLHSLDLEYINQYKKTNGLIRLFTPINSYRFPKPGLSSEDLWRLAVAHKGNSVDAYFSMMQESFFEHFNAPWHQSGFRYLCLPFAANPFIHYPRAVEKNYDYFMATSFGYQRALLTYQYTLPLFKKYHGLWAGTGWRFGVGDILPQETAVYRSKSKIILNPLPVFNRNYAADLTERAFTATACGAFQITNRSPITNQFFEDDELVSADSPAEFLNLFEQYLPRKDERNNIVNKGLMRVFNEHTYFHRIDKLLRFIDTL